MKYLYFYINPEGQLKPNDRLFPLDLIRAIDGDPEGLYLRFAFSPETKRIFVQDESFKRELQKGNEKAWSFLNHALENLNKKANARFLDRIWGDPQDSGIARPLSHYGSCWRDLNEILGEEFDVKPLDINVYEYMALPDRDEKIELLKEGSIIGTEPTIVPMIGLNRRNPSLLKEGDVNFGLLNDGLIRFYLSKMPEIFGALGQKELAEKVKVPISSKIMFAIRDGDKTRIFDGKEDTTEETIKTGLPGYSGHVVVFDLDHGCKRICFKNKMLSDLSEPSLKPMYDDILSSCSKVLGSKKSDILSTFDHGLSTGFVSRLSRLPIAWTFIKEAAEHMPDIPLLLLPFKTDSKIVRNNSEEEEKSKMFRATRGLDIPYPFFVHPHTLNRGTLNRSVLDVCLEHCYGEANDKFEDEESFLDFLAKTKPQVKKDMSFLIRAGLSKKEILDFFAKDFHLFKRAEYRKIYEQVLTELFPKKQVKASMGVGLQINEHYVMLQDYINRSQHKPPKKLNSEPKKKHISPRTYEQLLSMKHDREMSYMKTIEQLLRESAL